MAAANNYVTNTNPDLENNFWIQNMNKRYRGASVALLDKRYSIISVISDMANNPMYTTVDKVEYSRLGNLGVSNVIASRNTNAMNPNWLDLGFSDNTWAEFRPGDGTLSDTGIIGKVQYSSPGVVTVSNANGLSFASGDFAAGANISFAFNISDNLASNATQTRFYVPNNDWTVTAVMRDDKFIPRRTLKTSTYEQYGGKSWGYAQQPVGIMAYNRTVENRLLTSIKKYDPIGGFNMPDGLQDTIRNKGQYIPVANLNNFEGNIQTALDMIRTEGGSQSNEITVLFGNQAMSQFQNTIGVKYIQYPGKDSTLSINGKVIEGINVTSYAYNGWKLNCLWYPALDDPKLFPAISNVTGLRKASSSMIFLDLSMVPGTEGNQSPIQKIIWGEEGTPEYGSYVINGLIGTQAGTVGKNYQPTSNAIDGVQWGIWCDSGVKYPAPQYFALIELTN